jgi:hypothetical protein
VKNIKSLYEEELCQIVLVLPDVLIIGREPESKQGLENMKLLLLLLLGKYNPKCRNMHHFLICLIYSNIEPKMGTTTSSLNLPILIYTKKYLLKIWSIPPPNKSVVVFPSPLMLKFWIWARHRVVIPVIFFLFLQVNLRRR